MRATRRVIPAFLAVAVVVLVLPIGPHQVRADTTAQLEAERAALLQQLAAISSQQSAATNALTTAEVELRPGHDGPQRGARSAQLR